MLKKYFSDKVNTGRENTIIKLKKDWPSIVGDRLASKSLPADIINNILFVNTASDTVRSELNMLRIAIIFKIRDRHRVKFRNISVTVL